MNENLKAFFVGVARLVVIAGIIYAVFSSIDFSSDPKELLEKPVSEFKGQPTAKNGRMELIKQRLTEKGIGLNMTEEFYNCLSHKMYSMKGEVLLKQPLMYCEEEYERDGKFTRKYYNIDGFDRQFSEWDGAHKKLEKYIKQNLNDEESYEHIQTLALAMLDGDGDPYINVSTDFSAKNAYGGIVKSRVTAKANIETGDLIEVSDFE